MDFSQLSSLAGAYFVDKPMEKSKLYRTLLDLSRKVYAAHTGHGRRRYLQVLDPTARALVTKVNAEMETMLEAFAKHMTQMNTRHYQQSYYQYESKNKQYHGRSVYTFLTKYRVGEGHETRATVYENFNMHIRSMLQKWIAVFFQNHDLCFDISFDNILQTEARRLSEQEAPEVLKEVFTQQKNHILTRIAKVLSYDALKAEMEDIYYKQAWDPGFRDNVRLLV